MLNKLAWDLNLLQEYLSLARRFGMVSRKIPSTLCGRRSKPGGGEARALGDERGSRLRALDPTAPPIYQKRCLLPPTTPFTQLPTPMQLCPFPQPVCLDVSMAGAKLFHSAHKRTPGRQREKRIPLRGLGDFPRVSGLLRPRLCRSPHSIPYGRDRRHACQLTQGQLKVASHTTNLIPNVGE